MSLRLMTTADVLPTPLLLPRVETMRTRCQASSKLAASYPVARWLQWGDHAMGGQTADTDSSHAGSCSAFCSSFSLQFHNVELFEMQVGHTPTAECPHAEHVK